MRLGATALFSALWQDARFGARILWRAPVITMVVILALALGIGANSAMFSVVDALLIHPLRYEKPEDLSMVFDRDSQGQLRSTSAGNFMDWRKARSFSGMAGWAPSTYVMSGLDRPVQVTGARVTANIFQVLGVKAHLGRTFLTGEDGLDGSSTVSRVAVISYTLWRDVLGFDPNVLGRTVRLNDAPFAIIGVMQDGFGLLNRRHQIWVPAVLNGSNRDYRYLGVVARRTVSESESSAEMQSISQSLADGFPANNRGWTAQVVGMQEWLVDRRVRTRLLMLFAAVGLVLLLACSNVASLLLARSSARSREIALRVSLGATSGRVVRQLLVESLILALLGGALGLVLAGALIRVAPSFIPPSAIPTTAPLELSALVIGFTIGVSLLTGLLFGMAPAIAASRPDVQEVLQDTSRGATGGRGRQLFRQAMVMLEVAVALALLSGAAMMTRSMQRLADVDLGVKIENVLTQRILLPAVTYNAGQALRFHRQVMERAAALPGVSEVAMGSNLPLARLGMEVAFDPESAPVRALSEMNSAAYTTATPGYFHLLGVSLIEGRDFAAADSETAPGVAIVNATFVKRFFPNGGAVGQRIRLHKPVLGANDFAPVEYVQIVGVAGDVTLDEIGVAPPPMIYAPVAQNVWNPAHWLAVRSNGDPARISAAVRELVLSLDPNQPQDPPTSLEGNVAAQFAEPRFQSRLMGGFALLAFVLALVGVYSVNAYAVTQRTREIGVRLALGETPGSVMQGVLVRGMKVTLVGIALGLAAAAALSSILASALLDVGSIEAVPTLGAALVLTVAAAMACWLPAWRATRIHPAIALRNE